MIIITDAIDQGKRKTQEDSLKTIKLSSSHYFCIVCDGLGGHPGGDKASQKAIEICERQVVEFYEKEKPASSGDVEQFMHNFAKNTHKEFNASEELVQKSGTTVASAFIGPDFIISYYCGDSIFALFDQEGVLKNRIKSQEFENGMLFSCLMRGDTDAFGYSPIVEKFTFNSGDTLLLASDGIETIDFLNIHESLFNHHKDHSKHKLAPVLLKKVVDEKKKTQDNISIITVYNKPAKEVCGFRFLDLEDEQDNSFSVGDDTFSQSNVYSAAKYKLNEYDKPRTYLEDLMDGEVIEENSTKFDDKVYAQKAQDLEDEFEAFEKMMMEEQALHNKQNNPSKTT